jgi:ABC-type uncharacterized transport system auxiliary subunit
MQRRFLLLLLGAAGGAGCTSGLSQRPFAERREWPLLVRRPGVLPPRVGGRVLLVRNLRASPGLEARGLQSVQADGSIRTDYYEEWSVPPAEAVEDDLRQWLAESGLFAAVVAPGARVVADVVLEGELNALWYVAGSGAAGGQVKAALGVVVLDQTGGAAKVKLQRRFEATAVPTDDTPAAVVAATLVALATMFAQIEAALRA